MVNAGALFCHHHQDVKRTASAPIKSLVSTDNAVIHAIAVFMPLAECKTIVQSVLARPATKAIQIRYAEQWAVASIPNVTPERRVSMAIASIHVWSMTHAEPTLNATHPEIGLNVVA